METGIDLFNLDVLPPRCSVESVIGHGPDNSLIARFRAERRVWRRWRFVREHSEWSGWFRYAGEPIALRWDTFWPNDAASSAQRPWLG